MMALLRQLRILGSCPPTFNSDSGGVMDTEMGFHMRNRLVQHGIRWFSEAINVI